MADSESHNAFSITEVLTRPFALRRGGGGKLFDVIPKGGQGLVVSPYIISLAIKLHIFPEGVSLIADMPSRKICSTMIFAEI